MIHGSSRESIETVTINNWLDNGIDNKNVNK